MQRDHVSDHPPATVIPFPARLRSGKIRRTATVLLGSTKKGADYHWRRTVGDMRRQMERAGIASTEVETELAGFRSAVQSEMNILASERANAQTEGGAA